jgi:hypothetical protein
MWQFFALLQYGRSNLGLGKTGFSRQNSSSPKSAAESHLNILLSDIVEKVVVPRSFHFQVLQGLWRQ